MKEEVPIWFHESYSFHEAHASRKHTYDVNHLPKMVYSDEQVKKCLDEPWMEMP